MVQDGRMAQTQNMKDSDSVRSAMRVLRVLEALNAIGTASVTQLHARTELPMSTIVRLLHTLIETGYVRQVSRTAGYAATEQVLRLSDGFQHAERVVAVARGHMDVFTATHKWPLNLQVYDRGAMCPRYFTGSQSPLNGDQHAAATRFRRHPVLTTAHGQVYLGFCTETERALILAMLRKSKRSGNALAHDAQFLAGMLVDVQSHGYAIRAARSEDRVVGFAVPIRHGSGVAATVGLRYYGVSMEPEEAVRGYLPALQELAAAVASVLASEAALSGSMQLPA